MWNAEDERQNRKETLNLFDLTTAYKDICIVSGSWIVSNYVHSADIWVSGMVSSRIKHFR